MEEVNSESLIGFYCLLRHVAIFLLSLSQTSLCIFKQSIECEMDDSVPVLVALFGCMAGYF